MWFGVSIVATLAVTILTAGLFVRHNRQPDDLPDRVRGFVGERFARVWDVPAERRALAEALVRGFDVGVELADANTGRVERLGPSCTTSRYVSEVRRGGRVVGSVGLCWHKNHSPLVLLVALGVALLTLWALAGRLARHLTRPLRELSWVTEQIGRGDYSRRVRLGRRYRGEVRQLAESVNEMADRIERQMKDQRELLATVSHEVRTPLGHLGVLAELLREQGGDARLVEEVEHEIEEIDSLMGDLLASSRLDFSALSFHPLHARDLGLRALERAGLDSELLIDETTNGDLRADATLLLRALANLLDNARQHGGGVTVLRLTGDGSSVSFVVEDDGPGFTPSGLQHAFDSFYRDGSPSTGGSSLGLGLALVQRVAAAHGGKAWAENRAVRGALVGIRILRQPPDTSSDEGGSDSP